MSLVLLADSLPLSHQYAYLDIYMYIYISISLFDLYAEYIMRNARLEETQAGIKIAERNINNPDTKKIPLLWQKVKKN